MVSRLDGSSEAEAIPRPTARVVLRAPTGQVLLLEGRGFAGPNFWFLPGGGAHHGEPLEECARREVYEETSYRVGRLHGPVWRRAHSWQASKGRSRGRWYRSEERFFVADVEGPFEAAFACEDDPEQADIGAYRWWSLADIAASDATFAPRRLGVLLGMLKAPYGPEIEVGL